MNFRSIMAVGAALSALAAANAQAQDTAQEASTTVAAQDDALGLNVIVVTASARQANAMDSSVSVSVLSPDLISDAAPRTTAEIFRQIPGIRSESTGGDGNANIAVRGLPVASGGAKFLQLQEDGLPVMQFGDIAFGNADIFLRADQTIQSIQAVRGGSASTLASNAPGGVINFVSKDGSQEGGTVMATAGIDYEEYRLDFNYGGSLGENTRFNIGGFWREGEGPRDAGYNGNSGYQIKANLTQEFDGGFVRLHVKHLDDRAIGYLPMPTRVTGTNADPKFGSIDGFDIKSDTPHSKYFTSAFGLDGNNDTRTTDIKDGMHPLVTSLGLEAQFEIADGFRVEERFRWSDVSGRFVSPFPSEIGAAGGIGNSVGELLTGVPGNYDLVYANGPNAGSPFANSNGLLMRTHLFNVDINDFGGFSNDFKLVKEVGPATLTAGYYKARQNIDMDWIWDSFLLEVEGHNAALVDVVDPVSGNTLTDGGLYAYGVPYWGNCCQRSYDVRYDIDAPYAAVGFEFGDLSLDGSLRYDHVKARGEYAGNSQMANLDVNGDGTIQPVERSVSTIDNANASPVDYNVGYWSWSVGANYRFTADLAAFARVSRGGRANADRLLFGVVQADGSVRKEDAVDFVDQYELGVKYRNGPFALFVTGFHAKTQEQNFEATSQTFFDRTYKATGVELEGAFRSGIFDLRAGATYTDAEIAKDNITPANEGNTPRRQAKFVYQLTPAVDFDIVRAGFNIVGTSKAYAQDSNQLVFPAFTQVNAFVNIRPRDDIELSINANNLFDTTGITEAEEGSIVEGMDNYLRARSINGRTISASLRYDF
ncbi:TonB-dependent receptor [Croceicoccus ponticola]|uniref:TonB-dependent receptor n=1 Tax=Croceicoccus ponticola TaxID=2217664 RepID=A0A437GZP5_9SPHN|nr:TonB-dependent receptor [Croceicoccus ponticola]RVQ68810.1 TonB-dependent receptor [Croceicoccus ponticola]